MIEIPPIPVFVIYITLSVRISAFIIFILVFVKAFKEFLGDGGIGKSTKQLLLVLLGTLLLGSTIPLIQSACYLAPICHPILSWSILLTSIVVGINSLLTAIFLYFIYFTKEEN